jgi:S-adenosylmethionine/arginine decarboxylase-like enzyme
MKINPKLLKSEAYGQEYILDIHEVDPEKFEAKFIKTLLADLCDEIKMSKGPSFVWGTDSDMDELKDIKADGISCCQFLHSSSIVGHFLDKLQQVHLNIFSCNNFSTEDAKAFILKRLGGKIAQEKSLVRK